MVLLQEAHAEVQWEPWVTKGAVECGRDPKLDREITIRECEPLKSHKGSDIEL